MTRPEPEASAKAAPARRERDADRTRAQILEVATRIFAQKGLNGARVDEIAAATGTSKRMIYYYFASKEGLYEEVLARCYADIRRVEGEAGLLALPPREALRQIVSGTFDYHMQDGNFVRLVAIENIQNARSTSPRSTCCARSCNTARTKACSAAASIRSTCTG
ncbi:TetR/AcrR family transcriptional regulator [Novosphingobium sp. 1949]|uniref:TetR/AcrR family transcriptional regulator n=1 Tax=Novosphingobium organovorum TaxID=2930092 RepID=A0ABT0BHD1_9SPHN|nr:TetR/AcrR family transcriptional regulator [Novosphingobium organovorum]MCJ2184466.1 TetR/AcrR family transcriptional regulator [Novosphingobium organovorum]